MKKKKTANLIMVLIIAAIAIAGVVTAFMLKTSTGDGLGSQYQIRELKDNAVITPGQEDHVCAKASDCLKCGQCEDICPQHLSIRELLEDVAKVFEKQ